MPINELEHFARGQLSLLHVRKMAALRDELHLRAWDIACPNLGVTAGQELVVLSPEDERGHLDAMQPALESRVEPARLPAELRRSEAVDECELRFLFIRYLRKHALGEGAVVEEALRRLLRRPDEVVAHGNALDANPRGCDQRERGETRAIAHRQLGGDPAAEGVTDEMHALSVETVEHIEVVHGHVGDIADPPRVCRSAETGMLRSDDPVRAGELLEKRAPWRK